MDGLNGPKLLACPALAVGVELDRPIFIAHLLLQMPGIVISETWFLQTASPNATRKILCWSS